MSSIIVVFNFEKCKYWIAWIPICKWKLVFVNIFQGFIVPYFSQIKVEIK